ncbi:MAG TPA: hypothetical protein VN887_11115 [Candidatus Angelobacter sp.]|nr:hypothetical protein [Candidatus Angelobacter sp.]
MSIFRRPFGRGDGNDDGGETPEFKAFLEGSVEGLRLQTGAHQGTWHFGKEERWDFSQDTGELVFTFPDKIVRAPSQIIGSFDSRTGTWMWAWANSSISESLTRDSLRVRQYGEQNHILRLTSPEWSAEEMDAWHMTALACRLCCSNGAYRGPAGTTFVFITFGEVQLSKRI